MVVSESKVELNLRCAHLPSKDLGSNSDPFAVVYMRLKPADPWEKVDQTEVIPNQNHPQWMKTISLTYKFEEMQYLKIEIYDKDKDVPDLDKQDFIGEVETNLAQIVGGRGSVFTSSIFNKGKMLKKGKSIKKTKLTVVANEVRDSNEFLEFSFRAEKLAKKNMGGFGKSDPFYIISVLQNDQRYLRVVQGEVVRKNVNPCWRKRRVALQKLCYGDEERSLKVDIFDHESNGKHKFIGCFITTLKQLKEKKEFSVINVKSKKKSNAGKLVVEELNIVEGASFLDYIKSGCEVETTIAVDVSAMKSNCNEYLESIEKLGPLLENYDSDKNIRFLGFGADKTEIPKGMDPDCFPLNLENIEVPGAQGILKSFQDSKDQFSSAEGTSRNINFSKIVNDSIALNKNKSQAEKQHYSILLLLTTGNISDRKQTIEKVIEASQYPLSIIIIGVGEGEFSVMEELDNDDGGGLSVQEGKKKADRDIVQFVHLNDARDNLPQEALEEVPEQMENFFNSHGISPIA